MHQTFNSFPGAAVASGDVPGPTPALFQIPIRYVDRLLPDGESSLSMLIKAGELCWVKQLLKARVKV